MALRLSLTTLTALFSTVTLASAQAPANDDCANATVIALGSTALNTINATDGTGAALDPMVCDMGPFGDEQIYQDVWFSFTAPSTNNFDIAVQNLGNLPFDSRLAIYNQSTCPDLPANVIGCDDDSGPSQQAKVSSLALNVGQTVLVRAGSFAGFTTEQPGGISIVPSPPPPAAPSNDDCGNSSLAILGFNSFDPTGATNGTGQALDPMVCSVGGTEQIFQDVWFDFTPGSSGSYDIAVINNGNIPFDSRLAVYNQSTCPDNPANVIACDDDSGPGTEAAVSGVALTAGVPVKIRVGAFSDVTVVRPGALSIGLTPSPPANDDCATASVASLGLNPFDSTSATDGTALALDPLVCDMGPFGDEQIYQDVWFTFSPVLDGTYELAIVDNGNPSFDSRIAIYDGTSCPAMPMDVVGCDDDSGPGFRALRSIVKSVQLVNFLVRVGSAGPSVVENPAALSITMVATPPVPGNDDCANATPAVLGLNAFDSRSATDGAGLALDPMVCDMGTFGDEQIYQDVWYSFTPATTSDYDIAIVNNGNASFDNRLAVYNQSTCPDNPANVIACDDDSGGNFEAELTTNLTGGTTYLLRLGSFNSGTVEQPAALSIDQGPLVANDDCDDAEAIMGFGSYPFDNALATDDSPDLNGFCDMGQFGDDGMHDDVWFAYTPTETGCSYITTLNLAGFDTRIAVFDTTTCRADPATVIGCSDDETGNFPFEAGLDVPVVAGSTYLIAVGNFSEATVGGAATLMISSGPGETNPGSQPGAPTCVPPSFPDLCNGDGGDQMGCTDCPCGNNSPQGTIGGCMNSAGTASRLAASGDTSISLPSGDTTDLRFNASGMPPTAFGVLISGNGVAPGNMANPCFGQNSGVQFSQFDGLRCAVQQTQRHGGRSANAMGIINDSAGPSRVWGGEAQPAAGIGAQAGFVAGQTRYFQINHREDAMAVCMRGLNNSQAVEVTFTP